MRLSRDSWLSNKSLHAWSISLSSKTPVSSSFNHMDSTCFSECSYRFTVIIFLRTSTSHWGSKITILSSSGEPLKWTTILWSCRKFNKVENSASLWIMHSSNAMRLASFSGIHLSCSIRMWSKFSYFNHLNGIFVFISGNSFATASTFSLRRTTSRHSWSPPDLVLSTAKTSLKRCSLYAFLRKNPYISSAWSLALVL